MKTYRSERMHQSDDIDWFQSKLEFLDIKCWHSRMNIEWNTKRCNFITWYIYITRVLRHFSSHTLLCIQWYTFLLSGRVNPDLLSQGDTLYKCIAFLLSIPKSPHEPVCSPGISLGQEYERRNEKQMECSLLFFLSCLGQISEKEALFSLNL